MKAVVAAFNQEKALVGAFSVLTNLRMELFQALLSTLHLAHCITLLCLLCQVRREDTARLHHTGSISGCPVSGSEVHLRYYIIALDVNTGYHCSWVFVGSNTGNDWSCTTQSSVTCTCGKCLKWHTQNSKLISYRFRSQQFRHFHTLIILSTQCSQSKNNLYWLQ